MNGWVAFADADRVGALGRRTARAFFAVTRWSERE
jgi:hypothetical protein